MPIKPKQRKHPTVTRSGLRTRWKAIAALAFGAAILSLGCSSLSFYTQGVRGGLEILRKRQPIEVLVQDSNTPAELRERLRVALEIRNFATEVLGLPDNGSYRHYTHLDRPYAVWNVVAAPELDLDPVRWCFPVAGCVSYRGYFARQKAEAFGSRLRDQGLDVSVSGVTTYSTLGWFKDPILSTFIQRSPSQLAGVIFHELAHQQLYLKGDTTFNESFATVVEQEGLRRWLAERDGESELVSIRVARERHEQIIQLVLTYQGKLKAVYSKDANIAWKRSQKALLIDAFHNAYTDLKKTWEGYSGYDAWIDSGVHNAFFASVGSYHDWEPAFEQILQECKRDLDCFFRRAERLSELAPDDRAAQLETLSE